MNSVLFAIVFVFLATLYPVETEKKDNYDKLFSAWHCYLHMICKPGSGWICAVASGTGYHASFFDKCDFHGANCQKQGQYLQISTALCKPLIFFGEALTAYHGEEINLYLTQPWRRTTTQTGRRQKRPKTAEEKPSIFTKIKDYIGISANFSMHY